MRKLIIAFSLLLVSTSALAAPEFPCPDCKTPIEFRDAAIWEIWRLGLGNGYVTIVNRHNVKYDVQPRTALLRGGTVSVIVLGLPIPNLLKITLDVEAQDGSYQQYYDLKLETIHRIRAVQTRMRSATTPSPDIYKYLHSFPPPARREPVLITPMAGRYVQGFASEPCPYCDGNGYGTGYWRAPSYGPVVGATVNEFDVGAMDNYEIGREWLADTMRATGLSKSELAAYMDGMNSAISTLPVVTPPAPAPRYVARTAYRGSSNIRIMHR